ncbi:PREDICTED: uncharacterized protein LOC104747598 [Camelina sativa]|uniref:Uncharacterized protein LOC104747598 n=1 Tax=Camelina sativa TaxID=90675 RepID=A0ABM0W9B0_CAMSA|nr:PREDICTED: uncharacterized protein LOC104747598 [Camelina sativa]
MGDLRLVEQMEALSNLGLPTWGSEKIMPEEFPQYTKDPGFFESFEAALYWMPEEKVVEVFKSATANPRCVDNNKIYGDTEGLDFDFKEYFSRIPEADDWFRLKEMEPDALPIASRTSGEVNMNSYTLVENMMNVDKWKSLFSSIVVDASMVSAVAPNVKDIRDFAEVEIKAEIQALCPWCVRDSLHSVGQC